MVHNELVKSQDAASVPTYRMLQVVDYDVIPFEKYKVTQCLKDYKERSFSYPINNQYSRLYVVVKPSDILMNYPQCINITNYFYAFDLQYQVDDPPIVFIDNYGPNP